MLVLLGKVGAESEEQSRGRRHNKVDGLVRNLGEEIANVSDTEDGGHGQNSAVVPSPQVPARDPVRRNWSSS